MKVEGRQRETSVTSVATRSREPFLEEVFRFSGRRAASWIITRNLGHELKFTLGCLGYVGIGCLKSTVIYDLET
jgi:hypothetical protein